MILGQTNQLCSTHCLPRQVYSERRQGFSRDLQWDYMCNIPSKNLWDQRHWINTKHRISTMNNWTMLHKSSLFSTLKAHRMCWSFGRFKKCTTVLNSENQEQNLGCPWVPSALLIPQPSPTSFRKTALLQKQSVYPHIFLRASTNVLKILWCIHCYTFLFAKGGRGSHCGC